MAEDARMITMKKIDAERRQTNSKRQRTQQPKRTRKPTTRFDKSSRPKLRQSRLRRTQQQLRPLPKRPNKMRNRM